MSATTCYVSLPPFFFFNDTATTEIYTLSLHDALPICMTAPRRRSEPALPTTSRGRPSRRTTIGLRSEEHTSELQSRPHLVCRLLLEKKNSSSQPTPRVDQRSPLQWHLP